MRTARRSTPRRTRSTEIREQLDHPVIGTAMFEGVPFTSTAFAPHHWRSGPLLGEDNHWVLTSVLGLDPEEVDSLQAEGVLT